MTKKMWIGWGIGLIVAVILTYLLIGIFNIPKNYHCFTGFMIGVVCGFTGLELGR